MNTASRKINLINWLSTLQEDSILKKVEQVKSEKPDWLDTTSAQYKKTINEGLEQLDRG